MVRIKILARRKLKMTEGKLASQATHAGIRLQQKYPKEYWSCVVLQAGDIAFEQAKKDHPEHVCIVDSGYTEVTPNSETCLAFYEPDTRNTD